MNPQKETNQIILVILDGTEIGRLTNQSVFVEQDDVGYTYSGRQVERKGDVWQFDIYSDKHDE